MAHNRFNEIMMRRDRISRLRFKLPENFTYQDGLIELGEAIEAKSETKINEAMDHLAFSMDHKLLKEAVKFVNSLPSSAVRIWIRNLDEWFNIFDPKREKYLDDVILETKQFLLWNYLDDYVDIIASCIDKLKEITQLDWTFDGFDLVSSPSNDWRESNPECPNKCANKIIDVLISRGLLSGRYDDIKVSFYGPNTSDNRWHCQVIRPEALLTIDRQTLLNEIHEASALISKITNKQCHILNLSPVNDGKYYRILEDMGLIKVKEYYAFNVKIRDFNIEKLRRLSETNKTVEMLWIEFKSDIDLGTGKLCISVIEILHKMNLDIITGIADELTELENEDDSPKINSNNKQIIPEKYNYEAFKRLFLIKPAEEEFVVIEASDLKPDDNQHTTTQTNCIIM